MRKCTEDLSSSLLWCKNILSIEGTLGSISILSNYNTRLKFRMCSPCSAFPAPDFCASCDEKSPFGSVTCFVPCSSLNGWLRHVRTGWHVCRANVGTLWTCLTHTVCAGVTEKSIVTMMRVKVKYMRLEMAWEHVDNQCDVNTLIGAADANLIFFFFLCRSKL